MGMNHRIHIGFHFHVNFYHADLGDTNDEQGFGRDLSCIRAILEILQKANNAGQPVQAAWDFEGDYTLGRILPSLGPDVIDNVKGRLRERGDELLMAGTHAQLFAAMTGKELRASLQKACSNALGETSGVVRTDNYIFSPSIIGELRDADAYAILLGNSSVGPDAMTTVCADMRKKDLIKYNPVTYRHGEDTITAIPVYNPGEFMDEGGLTAFLAGLREKQMSGEIESDLFVLIGDDVRSAFWESMGIKTILGPVTGTEGLSGFLKELRKLDYVAYNTPSGYLKDHRPVTEISFAGDVAGGPSGDFSAFSELPYDRMIWTRLERGRLGSRVYNAERMSDSLQMRDKLLSVANFGSASPAPCKDRFREADKLSLDIQATERAAINEKEMSMRTSGRQRLNNSAVGKYSYSRRKDDEERNSFIIMNHKGQRTVSFQLAINHGQCPKISTLILECDECQIDSYTGIEMARDNGYVTSAFVVMRFAEAQNTYKIYYHFDRSDLPKEIHKPLIEVKPEDIPVFHAEGAMKRLLEAQGKLKAEEPKEKPADSGENGAVAERIAAMNSAANVKKVHGVGASGERETYVIDSPGHKLRVIVTGAGAGKGKIREVFYGDERIGDEQFLSSYIKCGGQVTEFECSDLKNTELSGTGEGITITGAIHARGESAPGKYSLSLIHTPALRGIEGILVHMDVTYPEMAGTSANMLEEIVPFQISPLYRAGVSVIRKSFTGDVSDYPVSVFGKAVSENGTLGSFNQQLTAGVFGIKGALSGILIGQARSVLSGMAMCPGRLITDGEGQHLSLNPNGTYGATERIYPSKSGGLIQRYSDNVVSDEKPNIAAAYSGVRERFCMCITGFPGATPQEGALSELSAFSDGAVICGDEIGVIHPFEKDNVILPGSQRDIPAGRRSKAGQQDMKALKSEISKYFYHHKK